MVNKLLEDARAYSKAYDDFFKGKVLGDHPLYYDFVARLCEGRTLDVACANGGWLLERVPDSTGVDFSPEAVEQLKRKGLNAVVGDAHALPFEDASYQTVVSLGALEHFANPSKAVAEMGRVLKPGGRLVLTINADASLPYRILEVALVWWGRFRGVGRRMQPFDTRLRTSEVRGWLLDNGLRILIDGSYSVAPLSFGRFQRLAAEFLPFGWRAAECTHVFYCIKAGRESIADYGPYFPRR